MVKIKIDLENRSKLRQLHTATHILNYSLREVLGSHIWQNGSNLKAEIGSLDITHYENLTAEEIFKTEKLCNKVIFENKKVITEELERTKAEQKYGFTLYQGGAIPMKTLRVVRIEENDTEACGGLHMESTGGIGVIKIIDTQKIQDGVVRVRFVVNNYALDFISEKQLLLKNICNVFNVDESSVVKTSEKFFNEWKERGKEIDKLKIELKNSYIELISNSEKKEYEIKGNYDMAFMTELFVNIIKTKKSFKLLSEKIIIATSDFSIENSKKAIDKKEYKIYIM